MPGDADRILFGGRIFTGERNRTWAKAIAIRGGRILAVGTDAVADRWAGRRTRRTDLEGRVVVPGFIDAHAHLADSAGELGWTHLDGTRDLAQAIERLRTAAAHTPPGSWVIGVDWDEAKWSDRRFPNRDDLDRVSTTHPVVARRIDCHVGVVNSFALEQVRDLAGARGFEVDTSGRPTGVLSEDAFGQVHGQFESGETEIEQNLERVTRMAHRLGITSIHDVVDSKAWRVYQRAHRAGQLRLRVYGMLRDDALLDLASAGLMSGLGDEWLRLGAVKVFSDGSLGAHTAALTAAYSDRAAERGMLIHSPTELRGSLETAHRAGLQSATHAIGDAAIRLVVETLASIEQEFPSEELRHRIEHYELPDDEILTKTKTAGLVASCQPNFIGQWSGPGDIYETRLGLERAWTNNPYRRIVQLGIPLCFGSDGMPYGPLYGIHWAVNGFAEGQRIPVEEAIRAYSAGGAYAAFEENQKGTLAAGKLADLVVLDGDPFGAPETITGCNVRETWLNGERVFPR